MAGGFSAFGRSFSVGREEVKASVTLPNTAFQNFISIVSVFNPQNEQVVRMEAFHSKKTGEIEIARALIARLESGHILTMDALHTQKNGCHYPCDGE